MTSGVNLSSDTTGKEGVCVCLLSPLTALVYKLSSPGIGNMDASHSEKLVRFQLEKYPDVRVMYHKYYTTFCSLVMK